MAFAPTFAKRFTSTARIMSNVFFDVTKDGSPLGRITFKLYDDVVPKTTRNFRELCTGQNGFGYEGSGFHRVIPQFMLQVSNASCVHEKEFKLTNSSLFFTGW